jgi:mutual gliding-motility protein MglA
MVLVSYSGREINAKLVYYGPGLSGKTTNLEGIYAAIPDSHRGKMVSMKTKTERTLFFDFLPIQLGELSGFKTRFLLYTVPGQVYYNATRKLVLKGVDAVVFVADSKRGKMDENLESLQNLEENLKEHGLNLDTIPWVIQYNKRDLPDAYTIDELERALNPRKVPFFEASAKSGEGVIESFKTVSRMLLKHLSQQIGVKIVSQADEGGRTKEQTVAQAAKTPPAQRPEPFVPAAPETIAARPVAAQVPAPDRDSITPGGPQRRAGEVLHGPELEETSGPAMTAARAAEPAWPGQGAAGPVPPPPAPPIEASPAVAHTEPVSREASDNEGALDESAPLTVERVGTRLRRWFARPREVEDRPLTLEFHSERRESASEDRPQEVPAPPTEEHAVSPPIPGPEVVEAFEARAAIPVGRAESCREVPILIDLEPEDLEVGVVLKLKISVRRASDQASEDLSVPPMARAA